MGPKKGKKSKAELEEERLAKEAEELKAKALEEKRRIEDAEKKKVEEARTAAEQRVFREKELERWKEQYQEILDELKESDQQLSAEESNEAAQLEWLSYKNPTDEPNAGKESDMNTFISQTRECIATDMKDALNWVRKIEKLAYDVEDIWVDSLARGDVKKRNMALKDLSVLQEMIIEKIDQATQPMLRYSEKHINDKQIMQLDEIATNVSIGIWASYEEPRPGNKRLPPWEKVGVQFETVPKQLLQQSDRYILRVIRMPIVPYNLQAYHNQVQLSPPVKKAPVEVTGNDGGENKESGDAIAPTGADAGAEATAASTSSPGQEGSSEEEKKDAVDGNGAAPAAAASAASSRPATSPTAPIPELDIPEDLGLDSFHTKFVVGDLIYFDIFVAPPNAFNLRVKKWTMRDNSKNSTGLRKSEYPSSVSCKMLVKIPDTMVMSDDLRMCVWSEERKDWIEDGISDYQYSESARMVQCYVTTVGTFALVKKRIPDLPLRSWSLYPVLLKPVNDLMEYGNDATAGLVVDLQKVNFRGLPSNHSEKSKTPITYERHARLMLQTKSHQLVIDIIGSQCCLIKPTTPLFADLIGLPFSPGALLKRLQRKGINLLPTDVDLALSSNYSTKHRVAEMEALKQIAACSNTLDFCHSSWNDTLNESQIGILARESTIYTCPAEVNDYECILVERDVVSSTYSNTPDLGTAPGPDGMQYVLVVGNDYARRTLFSPIPRPGEIRHLNVPRTLSNRISPEAMNRIKGVNQRFKKTIFTLLSLIKPYSLSLNSK